MSTFRTNLGMGKLGSVDCPKTEPKQWLELHSSGFKIYLPQKLKKGHEGKMNLKYTDLVQSSTRMPREVKMAEKAQILPNSAQGPHPPPPS